MPATSMSAGLDLPTDCQFQPPGLHVAQDLTRRVVAGDATGGCLASEFVIEIVVFLTLLWEACGPDLERGST